ncbi:g6734 [Coccomyxa elongata]
MISQKISSPASTSFCQQRRNRSIVLSRVQALHALNASANLERVQEAPNRQEAKCTCGKTKKPPNCDGSHAKKCRASQSRAGTEMMVQLNGQVSVEAHAHPLD